MTTKKANPTQTVGQYVMFYDASIRRTRIGRILTATASTQTVLYGNDAEGYRTVDIHHTKLTAVFAGPDGRFLAVPGDDD